MGLSQKCTEKGGDNLHESDKHFKAKHLNVSVLNFPGLPEEVVLTKYYFHETLIEFNNSYKITTYIYSPVFLMTGSYETHTDFELTVWLRMTLNFWFFCFYFLSTGSMGIYHLIQFIRYWGLMDVKQGPHQMSIYPAHHVLIWSKYYYFTEFSLHISETIFIPRIIATAVIA